jgi:hypothetical protein
VIAVEMHGPELVVLSSGGVTVGDGPVAVGQDISAVCSRGRSLPVFVVGERVPGGDALR